MNRFVTFVLVLLVGLAGLGTYWYVRPHHVPRIIGDLMPTNVEVPKLKSPVRTFRPPQF